MIEENLKSKCCGAEVEVSTADDLGVTSGGTSCYMCKKCNKPCDLQPYEVDYPRNKALEIINEKADTNHKEMVEAVKGIKLAKQNMFDQYNKFMKIGCIIVSTLSFKAVDKLNICINSIAKAAAKENISVYFSISTNTKTNLRKLNIVSLNSYRHHQNLGLDLKITNLLMPY